MGKLVKALDNNVEKAIIDYRQENYNGNIEYRNKITEKFNKIEGEMKTFNEAFKKIEIEVLKRINIYRLNLIEEYLFKSFTQRETKNRI